MQQKVNYIVHLNNAFQKLNQDSRLSPFHVSLYYSLFQYWNISKFRNPISISRDDQMQASKIGSVNTYLKCLKELDSFGYIKYEPSHNPMKGSQVYLFIFDNTTNTTNHITSNTTTDNGNNNTTGKSSETTLKKVVRPYTNSLNNLNSKNKDGITRTNNNNKSSLSPSQLSKSSGTKRKKVAQKKEVSLCSNGEGRKGEVKKPTLSQLETHFTAKKWPTIEAQKFFNYYQSNGWLVGGKTPMQSWKACASNWILNSEKFNNGKTNNENNKAGNLHTTTDKNYGEPL